MTDITPAAVAAFRAAAAQLKIPLNDGNNRAIADGIAAAMSYLTTGSESGWRAAYDERTETYSIQYLSDAFRETLGPKCFHIGQGKTLVSVERWVKKEVEEKTELWSVTLDYNKDENPAPGEFVDSEEEPGRAPVYIFFESGERACVAADAIANCGESFRSRYEELQKQENEPAPESNG